MVARRAHVPAATCARAHGSLARLAARLAATRNPVHRLLPRGSRQPGIPPPVAAQVVAKILSAATDFEIIELRREVEARTAQRLSSRARARSCVRVRACACVRACVRVCVRARACACREGCMCGGV
jgi:hypothetical protein